jgi:hypothetical protein
MVCWTSLMRWSAGAAEAAVSRSVLDSRFRQVLGRSPIRYLAEWRMHVARNCWRPRNSALLRSHDALVTTPRSGQPGVQAHPQPRAQPLAHPPAHENARKCAETLPPSPTPYAVTAPQRYRRAHEKPRFAVRLTGCQARTGRPGGQQKEAAAA